MKRWPNRVFAFLLAETEVNVSLGMVEFCGNNPTSQIEFRKKLAEVLIFNEYFNEEEGATPVKKAKKQQISLHSYCMLPRGKKSHDRQMVKVKSAYPQHKCTSCSTYTCGYCQCSPGVYCCNECYAQHLIGVKNRSIAHHGLSIPMEALDFLLSNEWLAVTHFCKIMFLWKESRIFTWNSWGMYSSNNALWL